MSQGTLRMPAEWAPHERTLIAWPSREDAWRGVGIAEAKDCYSRVVDAVSQFEPVMLVVNPGDEDEARRRCPESNVEVVALPIDDSWLRDSGPIIVADDDGNRFGVDFAFNAWGEKFDPFENDAAVSRLLLDRLDIPRVESGLVLEGGSIAVDGEGMLITTEQCNRNPNRNPGSIAADLETAFEDLLGIEQTIWLEQGLVEDADTDGHVDNICAFLAPGLVLLQTAAVDDPNHEPMQRNLSILTESGLAVEQIELLPRTIRPEDGEAIVVPYTNFYLCNGAAIVPVAGLDPDMDAEALSVLSKLLPGREVIGVEALALAFGGGGIHCITQQVPA